jgi:hypothetical protein
LAASAASMLALARPASALELQPPQSVSNLVVKPFGTHMIVKFHLFYAAIPTVALRRADDVRPLSATPYAIGGRTPAKDWEITVSGLQANTQYPLQISEPGTASRPKFVYNHNVPIKTWHRKVVLDSDAVIVDQTGDPSGCAQMSFDADRQVGYEYLSWMCDGDAYFPNNFVVLDAPEVLNWTVNVSAHVAGNGCGDCIEYASASKNFYVGPKPATYEAYDQGVQMATTPAPGSDVAAAFVGWLHVSYYP